MKEIIKQYLNDTFGYEEEILVEELTQLIETFYATKLETEYSLGYNDGYKEGEKYGYDDGFEDTIYSLNTKNNN